MLRLRGKKTNIAKSTKDQNASYSATRTSLADGVSIWRICEGQRPMPSTRTRYIWVRKCHHCNRNLRSCQNTENWEGCKLSRNPIWNAVSLKWRSSLDDACVSNSINGDRKIGKPVWSFPYTRRETWENPLTTVAFFSLASLEKCMNAMGFEKDATK